MRNPIANDELGLRLLLAEPPTFEDVERMRVAGVTTVWVNGFGMRDLPDLSVLDGVVTNLNVVTMNLASDASVVSLPRIRSLSLQGYAQSRIDFRSFQDLHDVYVIWRPGAETLFQNRSLRSVGIAKYPFADLTPLANLTELERLTIRNSRRLTSLAGIEFLPALKVLSLVDDQALVSLDPIGDAPCRLVELSCNGCRKLTSLEPVRGQTELETLAMIDGGRIHTLAPLADLAQLQRFWFYDSTVIADGDLSVLLQLPRLTQTGFANRRHYSHRSDEIDALLAAPSSRDIGQR